MIRRAFTDQHYTPEEVREHVLAAVAIVVELEVPRELREAAFKCAYQSLSAKQITYEQIQVNSHGLALPKGAG